MPSKITDHVQRGLDRLLQQFKGKPRIEALLTSWLQEFQAIEDAAWDLYLNRLMQLLTGTVFTNQFSAAMGFSFDPNDPFEDATTTIDPASTQSDLLDKIGKIVGQTRDGYDNQTFARLIAARIASNRSDGRRETLMHILLLLSPGIGIYAKQFQPKTILLEALSEISLDPYYVVNRFLGPAVADAEKLFFVWTPTDAVSTVILGSSDGSVPEVDGETLSDSGGGFNGGLLAGVTPN